MNDFASFGAQGVKNGAELWDGDRKSHIFLHAVDIEQSTRRAVYKTDISIGIEADNPRSNRPKHRVEQPTATFDLLRVFQQLRTLSLKLLCHLVEIATQLRDFIITNNLWNTNI